MRGDILHKMLPNRSVNIQITDRLQHDAQYVQRQIYVFIYLQGLVKTIRGVTIVFNGV